MYKLEIIKARNTIRITINDNIYTEKLCDDISKNDINITGKCINFRLNNKSNVLNTMCKIPKTIAIITKHINEQGVA